MCDFILYSTLVDIGDTDIDIDTLVDIGWYWYIYQTLVDIWGVYKWSHDEISWFPIHVSFVYVFDVFVAQCDIHNPVIKIEESMLVNGPF